jgi:hypothetical protein
MTKHVSATATYNAIFQEYSSPGRAITGRPPRNVQSVDKGISCHVFAIASPSSWDGAKDVNMRYSDIGSGKAIERAISGKKPTPGDRLIERPQNMASILAIRQLQATVLPVDNMFMCGGFREGQVVPEHMWIEDRTNNITYDTFINRNGIAVVEGVGVDGEEFEPGCESDAFEGAEISRVKVAGYTWGQLLAIASGAEKVGSFPDSIKDNPVVLAAKLAIKEVEAALAELPGAGLTAEELRVVEGVYKEQSKKTTQKDIDDVVKNLKDEYKPLHASGMEKLKTEGEEQRRVAREIVGRGPEFFLEKIKIQQLTAKANERIEATLAALPEGGGARDFIKAALEKKRDSILAGDAPAVALDAFNKSMSDGNITVLVQGIKDGMAAIGSCKFGDDDGRLQSPFVAQMKKLMTSYVANDGTLEELSLKLTEVKNKLTVGPYADVLAVTKRIQEMDGLSEQIKEYATTLVARMRELPLIERAEFPNSKEQATFSALEALLTTDKAKPKTVDDATPDLGQKVTEKLTQINSYLDDRAPKAELGAVI